jgi:hypothetical protein
MGIIWLYRNVSERGLRRALKEYDRETTERNEKLQLSDQEAIQ